MYMLATSPQNRFGFSEMKSGPGLKPRAPAPRAGSRWSRARDAEREQRHQRAARLGVVRALGRGDAFDHAGAELLAAARERLSTP